MGHGWAPKGERRMASVPGCGKAAEGGQKSFREVPRDRDREGKEGGGHRDTSKHPRGSGRDNSGKGGRGSRKLLLRREEQQRRV